MNRMQTGAKVQMISVVCSCKRCRLVSLYVMIKIKFSPTRTVIRVKIAIVKSWNRINCSIDGEALS